MATRDPVALTYDQHAQLARATARSHGLADCIHYAPDWCRRANALYAYANEVVYRVQGAAWWEGDGTIGILPDGRMVVVGALVFIVEGG
jgi:hypothetical protein